MELIHPVVVAEFESFLRPQLLHFIVLKASVHRFDALLILLLLPHDSSVLTLPSTVPILNMHLNATTSTTVHAFVEQSY